MKANFTEKTAVIVCHDSVFGPPHELRDFLNNHQIKTLLFIGHRNRFVKDNQIKTSYWQLFKCGKLTQTGQARQTDLPEFIGYIKDFCYTFVWCTWLIKPKIDIFIGLGNLNALLGLILRSLGLASQVIYYVIDYMPIRFENRTMNHLYHYIDRICASRSNSTWNYARQMIIKRQKYWKVLFPNQQIVPNGVKFRPEIIRSSLVNHQIVYIGTIFKEQGIQLVIETIPLLIEKYPDIRLHIIGQGPYKGNLKKLVSKMGLDEYIVFEGFIEDPLRADQIIAGSSVGVAMYRPDHKYVQYTEPGKVKRYLACGIPVIMSNISPLAGQLVIHACGLISLYDKNYLRNMLDTLFTDIEMTLLYRKNAIRFAKKFEWEHIFLKAFNTQI